MVRWILRAGVVALLAAAILDLPLPGGRARAPRIYLIDGSDSVAAAGRGALPAFKADRRELAPPNFSPFLAFARKTVPFETEWPDLDGSSTDLGAAIESALALAGDHGEIILATDGRDTAGHLQEPLLLATARRVPVHVFPLGPADAVDVRIAAVDVPASVAPGGRFDARVTLESTGAARGTLNGVPIEFAAPSSIDIILKDLPAAPVLELALELQDTCPANNTAEVSILVRDHRPRVLAPTVAAPLLPSCQVESQGNPEEFDAVIVDRYTPGLARAVRETGTGLIVLGGSQSYALGGFGGTDLEDVLPLWAFPEERATVVFVLDGSGSMNAEIPGSSVRRMDAATRSVESSLGLLHKDDFWAVVAFAGTPRTVVPLRQASGSIPRINPGGPTVIAPALDHALALAGTSPSGRKRIILITDGETREPEADLAAAGRKVAERGAEIVTVSADPSGMAKLRPLGGILVTVDDPLLLQEALKTAVARSGRLIEEPVAPLTVREHPLLAGLTGWPALRRINRTSAKPVAQILVTSSGHPVLALGTAGAGRVAALTLSLEDDWAGEDFPRWPHAAGLLQRLVDHVAPAGPGIRSASARLEGAEIVFSVRAAGGSDSLEARPVRLVRRGQDLYEGRVEARPGTTVLHLQGRALASFTLPHAAEYAGVGPDAASIQAITRTTGGRIIESVADLSRLPVRSIPGSRPGRAAWLISGLLLFLAEIALATFWRSTPGATPLHHPPNRIS